MKIAPSAIALFAAAADARLEQRSVAVAPHQPRSASEVCNATFDAVYAQEVGNRVADDREFRYMDFTGSSVFLNRQITEMANLYSSGVFGNPHSKSSSSQLSTGYVNEIRDKIYEFFSADPDEYEVVFTRSATGALNLLGESFPFSSTSGSSFAYTVSNHNSVLGIRSYAGEKGARFGAVTEEEVEDWLANYSSDPARYNGTVLEGGNAGTFNDKEKSYSLFAYPAKDNYAGVLYPLRWINEVQNMSMDYHEWLVLLDTAAYAPTYRLDLSAIHPDFVVISFYKLFGLPTGVGAFIIKRSSEKKLQRIYWGGSSVFTATATEPWELRYIDQPAKWEDGTLPFLEIASLKPGFKAMEYLGGIDTIQQYTSCLGSYMSAKLQSLRHSNGRPMLELYGKHYDDLSRQSSTANFQILKPSGQLFSYRTAARVLSNAGFQVRDGCMCNPGACYNATGVTDDEVRQLAMSERPEDCGPSPSPDPDASPAFGKGWEWIEVVRNGELVKKPLGSIRVSLGWMSRQDDIDALAAFLIETYKDVKSDPQPMMDIEDAPETLENKTTSGAFFAECVNLCS